MKIPFVFLTESEIADIASENLRHRGNGRYIKSSDGYRFSVNSVMIDGVEHTLVEYDNDGLYPPDNVWSIITISPPIGFGSELLQQNNMMLVPISVVNGSNADITKHIYNDGFVAFRTEFDAELVNDVEDFIQSMTMESFYHTLGASIIDRLRSINDFLSVEHFLIDVKRSNEKQ